ncbi:hypothetical protein D3C77_356020 [compost metagenome]
MLLNLVMLQFVAFQQAVVHKSAVIERNALKISSVAIPFLTQFTRLNNFIPLIKSMSPEPCIPSFIQILDRIVTSLEPYPERLGTVVAVTVPAVFVRHVPDQQSGMILITLGQLPSDQCRIFTVCWAVRTGIMSAAEFTLSALYVYAQHIRILLGHPCRMSCRACPEAYVHPVVIQTLNRCIQSFEIVGFFIRLQKRPGEHINRRHVNARQLEHTVILAPCVRSPLLRIVISAVPNFR